MIWKSLLLLAAVAKAAAIQADVVPNRYVVEFEEGAVSAGSPPTHFPFQHQNS
jgi:hypothetical protein